MRTGSIKINMVVKRGTNDHEIMKMANSSGAQARSRFIEFMDVGATNGWRMDVMVPSQVIARLQNAMALVPLEAAQPAKPHSAGGMQTRRNTR